MLAEKADLVEAEVTDEKTRRGTRVEDWAEPELFRVQFGLWLRPVLS